MAELLTDQLRMMAEHFADEPAAINVTTNEEMTFREWDGRSNALARWITDQGVDKGDRVAILIGPEDPFAFLVGYSAAHKAGAIAVPL
ncbi:MAG: AMP-binding protein, partial [Acidimicrobiales bacterium]|nr:AMP-binding protein [Acidimicrobiales bacterium]